MKSILILGASSLQVPLIEYVKRRGYRVIVVSIPGNYPGFDISDKSIYCDVRDVDGIMEAVRDDDIVTVLTDQTDISVPTVALLSQKLGLKGNDPDTAIIYSNKYLMREACKKANVPVPLYYHASNIAEVLSYGANFSFPAIMKPEDNQGSRGVFLVNSVDEILSHLQESLNYSLTKKVIVERFFQGKEVVVEGFVINGEYVNWGIADRYYFDLKDRFIPCQTVFPAKVSDGIKAKLLNAEMRLHASLNPSFGMIHSEYLINEETGDYILVETALRGGGVFISSHLVPLYTGFDNYALLLDCSLGKQCDISSIKKNNERAASAYICFYLPPGIVESVEGYEAVRHHPNVRHISLFGLEPGMTTHEIKDKTQRLGPIIVSGNNRKDIEETIRFIQENLIISVKTPSGKIESIKWN